MKTNRGLLKLILLSSITFGIYEIIVLSEVSNDINVIASLYDHRKTMHYCLLYFIFSWMTFGIASIVWRHNLSSRIGNELKRRNILYRFGVGSFWLWGIVGAGIFIGPYVYTHKLLHAMNLLCEDYNRNGA